MWRLILLVTLCNIFASSYSLAALNVVTTTEDAAAIAQSVGGDNINVVSLTKGTRDPHFATAKPSMIRKVSRADLLIIIGADLEIGWLPALMRSARNSQILPGERGHLDLSKSISLIETHDAPVSRDHGDVHAAGNPHYWLDPNNGLQMAYAIAKKLIELDPENASQYQKNLETFRLQLKESIGKWKEKIAFMRGKKVIAYHTSLNYLAKAFGFEIIDFLEPVPGISPSATHINRLIGKVKQNDVQYLLMEPYYETRSGKMLNRKTGIEIRIIPQSVGAQPKIKNYLQLFDSIVKTIAKGK